MMGGMRLSLVREMVYGDGVIVGRRDGGRDGLLLTRSRGPGVVCTL